MKVFCLFRHMRVKQVALSLKKPSPASHSGDGVLSEATELRTTLELGREVGICEYLQLQPYFLR